MNLLIRVDFDQQTGGGHAMRSLALAQEWKKHSGSVEFLMYSCPDFFRERLSKGDFDLTISEKKYPDISEKITTTSYDWVCLDGYRFEKDYQKSIKQDGFNLLVIDDHSQIGDYDCDLLLDQNLNTQASEYSHFTTSGIVTLLGTKFVLLRDEFVRIQSTSVDRAKQKYNVLVTFGATEQQEAKLNLIRGLRGTDKLENRICLKIIGEKPKNLDMNLCDEIDLEFYSNVGNMAYLLQQTDLAITGGGSTCWELCYMGVPHLILVFSSDQKRNARELEKEGAAINLGRIESFDFSRLPIEINNLFTEPNKRARMSQRGKELVDGYGRSRVRSQMEDML